MFVRRAWVPASERLTAPACGIAVATLLLVTGCGSHASNPGSGAAPKDTSAAMTACGETKTAANVPVDIQIAHGQVSCSAALAIERATPVVLKTGQASKCTDGSTEILAILPAPA
jgi:hypothetical protein